MHARAHAVVAKATTAALRTLLIATIGGAIVHRYHSRRRHEDTETTTAGVCAWRWGVGWGRSISGDALLCTGTPAAAGIRKSVSVQCVTVCVTGCV